MSVKNIVVTAAATDGIDIDYIELFLPWKRNRSFGSLNVKLSPTSLCQLFPNGKIIVIGGTTEKEFKGIFDMYLAAVADLGHPFPAVRYRDKYNKVTVNIFHTGSCVILGAKTLAIVGHTAKTLNSLLCKK